MNSTHNLRWYRAIAGGAALITVGVLSAACGHNGGGYAPATTPTTTSTATTSSSEPKVTPSEKDLSPNGANSFSPQVLAPPAPTEPPGVHRHR
jgi:hypothetical protein